MDKLHYEEMLNNINKLERDGQLIGSRIYLFGHCNATEALADLLLERGYVPLGILDNSSEKQGSKYRDIPILAPKVVQEENLCEERAFPKEEQIVCIVSRAYEAMARQLKQLGYMGRIEKLVDYNSFAEYSLVDTVIANKKARLERGLKGLEMMREKYPGYFMILCPFAALGDIFMAMSYLPAFLRMKHVEKCVVCLSGTACKQTAELFGDYPVESFKQKELDELIQACIYTNDSSSYIVHQDRPYIVKLHKALHIKCISLETIYKCGIYGLPQETVPCRPKCLEKYDGTDIIPGRTVILSPYAKSVTVFEDSFWKPIVDYFHKLGYRCLTNTAKGESALPGTMPISPSIAQLQSAVEQAGTFVGIRSGLCDVIRYAECDMTALYPDYNYSDTRWKAIDMYALEGWNNIAVGENSVWDDNI